MKKKEAMDKKEKMERKKIEREKKIVKRSGGLLNFQQMKKLMQKGTFLY